MLRQSGQSHGAALSGRGSSRPPGRGRRPRRLSPAPPPGGRIALRFQLFRAENRGAQPAAQCRTAGGIRLSARSGGLLPENRGGPARRQPASRGGGYRGKDPRPRGRRIRERGAACPHGRGSRPAGPYALSASPVPVRGQRRHGGRAGVLRVSRRRPGGAGLQSRRHHHCRRLFVAALPPPFWRIQKRGPISNGNRPGFPPARCPILLPSRP